MFCVKEYPGLSYPNLLGANRALQNPDVRALANLAELAGVDLRIVLLVRHPASVVRSGLRRGYEKSGLIHAIKMYTSTLSLLSSQLSLLDPSFIACWRYEAPTAGISDLVSFMGAQEEKPGGFNQVVAKQYKQRSNEMVSSAEAKQALQTATSLHTEILGKYCKASLADAYDASQALLPKRNVSQNCRFVFFAGIEGTGHHYWQGLLTHLHPFTNWSDNLSAELYNSGHKVGFFSTYNETLRSIHASRVMQLMTDADRSVREQGGGIVPLNVLCKRISGMMSYPNLLGANRALQNPDVRALANLAELAGVDLRIVLLVRHPASVVRSGLRRGYEKSGLIHAIKMYTSTLSLLSSQLSLLDPSFIACWRYEAPTAGISDLVSFMGAQEEKPGGFNQVVAKQYKQRSNEMVSSAEAKQALQTATSLHTEIL